MTNGITGPRPVAAPLPAARDAAIDPSDLAPWVAKYAAQYGADPEVMGAIIEQESSYVNHGVHRDGTGHGLVGLDDNGLLRDFERWSGASVGRGRSARTIAPEKQIEFLAKTLGELTQRFGDPWEAARAWHAGSGGRNRANGLDYERLLRGRLPNVIAWTAPTSGTEPPLFASASTFDGAARPRDPLRLDAEPGATPPPGDFDLGNT